MATNYAGKTVDELEKLAAEQQRRRAALAEIAKSNPTAIGAMTSEERGEFLKDNEQERTNAWHNTLQDARERRLDAVGEIAAREPGRYSAAQSKAAVDWLNREQADHRHLREQNTAVEISENQRKGMVGQGREAAEATANGNVEIAKLKEEQAKRDAAIKEMETKSRYGMFDENGNYVAGSEVNAAKEAGNWRLQQQELKNQGAANVQTLRNRGNADVAETQAGATVDAARARVEAQEKRRAEINEQRDQVAFDKYDKDINNMMDTRFTEEQRREWNQLKPEEKKAKWLELTGRNKQGQQEEGRQGAGQTFTGSDGVKYEILRDANGKAIGRRKIQ